VLNGLRHHLMDPELFREFCAEFTREINRQRGDQAGRREQLAAELRQVERRLRRMVEAIADGVPARTLKDELLALEHRQEGDMHIDLHGELAGILGLCREGRRGGGFDAQTVAQIKVVAGAHNHRPLALPPVPV
jgi:hypothetical protein